MLSKTKIVCTIGPASSKPATLEKLVRAGMNVARLNFSHGTHAEAAQIIKDVRKVSQKLRKPIAILQDLQGPRIRVGKLSPKGIVIKENQTVLLYPDNQKPPAGISIPIQYHPLHKKIRPKHHILIADGLLELETLSVQAPHIKARVVIGGLIRSHSGINLPDTSVDCPAITAKDKKDLAFGVKQGVDFIALSFVKNEHEILRLKRLIWEHEKNHARPAAQHFDPINRDLAKIAFCTRVIAKIERPEACRNINKIIHAADGIMVARGDLGLEVPLQDVPTIQKETVNKCLVQSKPVIIATQMLDSMIEKPRPTRAEVSDVANAILDGTDAIMLSGETSIGKYPVKAVQTMTKIAQKTETGSIYKKVSRKFIHHEQASPTITQAVSFSIKKMAEELNAKAIVCATNTGFTARAVARFKPEIPLFAITPSQKTENQLSLSWGVNPYRFRFDSSVEPLIQKAIHFLKQKQAVKKNDRVVVAAGYSKGYRLGRTNLIKVHIVR